MPTYQKNLEDRLDEVIAGYLRDGGSRQTLIEAHPELADDLRSFFGDQDRLNRMAAPLRAVAVVMKWPARIGPYEVLGELGRGGVGVVLRARHTELGRDAALKLLLAGRHATEDELARFRREAHAAASLDHPNIVPLYEVGEHDGLPYLVMKRMAGSLAGFKPESPRHAARLVALIARAVHHAHERGLLHRDLKPANVLLDADGSPRVSDFGLARRADSPGTTATGTALGTPAYMSPEQAAGRVREVTVASDVWGLGAILYELLTGRPPFSGDTVVEVLRKVMDEEPASPRSLAPSLNPALDTVVRKCLDKVPARRYGSALALAEDLERWLGGEPILAQPAGRWERVWRWVRKHPAVAGLSGLLAVAVVTGGVLVTQQWLRAENALVEMRKQRDEAEKAEARVTGALKETRKERDEAEKAHARADTERDEAQKARARADASFRLAHKTVNDFLVDFSKELSRLPGSHALQQKQLLLAHAYLEDFVRQKAGDAGLRGELADTHFSLAQLKGAIGDRGAARKSYDEALAIYRRLHAESPGDGGIRRKLAATLTNVANFQGLTPGLVTRAEAMTLYRRFLCDAPDDRDLASGLALAVGNQGTSLLNCGRLDDARGLLEEAIQRQRELCQRSPKSVLAWRELAGSIHNYGVLLSRSGDRLGALWVHQRCADLRGWLRRQHPKDGQIGSELASTQHHIGLALQHLGQADEGNRALDAALALRRKVAAENPLVVRFQADLAGSLSSRGVARNAAGKRREGLALFHQARKILQEQAEADPADAGLRAQVGEAWFNIGATHGALNERQLEGDAFEEALKLQQPLVDADPESVEYRHALSRTLNNLGLNYGVRRRDDRAVPILMRAVANTRRLLARSPGLPKYRHLMNGHLGLLAYSLYRLGEPTASAGAVGMRAALWPDSAVEQIKVARDYARLLPKTAGPLRARIESRALECVRRAIKNGYEDLEGLRAAPELKPLHGLPAFQKLFSSSI